MGGRRGKGVDPEDVELFRRAVGPVAPVPSRRRPPEARTPPARARFRRADERAVMDEALHGPPPGGEVGLETGEELRYARPGIGRDVLRRLRRGHYRIQDELDLHGMTAEEARRELKLFMGEALQRGLGCVRIVHGKGLRSGPGGPVLKARLNRWLPRWDEVLAFVSAPARDGGTGALYVLLRR